MSTPLLDVNNLTARITNSDGLITPVNGVSFQLEHGKTTALVGESGSGKSMTAMSLIRLLPPGGEIVSGAVLFCGRRDKAAADLTQFSQEELRTIRGSRIAVIFQEPMTALTPVFTIGNQICEVLTYHRGLNKRDAREAAIGLLAETGIADPPLCFKSFPHEISGGMRQRAMIAMALACEPDLLIADEPTTALDTTIQAQILDLLTELKERHGMGILLITHDLGVVAENAQSVNVMYAGRIVESAGCLEIFNAPRHPYTKGLIKSTPTLKTNRDEQLYVIKGQVPSFLDLPAGCCFADRCPEVMDVCLKEAPALAGVGSSQTACWAVEA